MHFVSLVSIINTMLFFLQKPSLITFFSSSSFINLLSLMGFFWAFVYTHLLSILLVSCDSKVDVTQSLIVRVQNDLKPSGYSDVEDWYRSTIKSLNASQNPNISNLEEGNYFLHVYDTVFEGFSVKLTTLQAEELSKRPEILGVFPDRVRQIQTTRSPEFLGLEASGINGLLNESDWGSNTIIGVIDTGIWPERSSFHDQDLGPVPSHWKGECVPGQQFPKTLCNKKLIGARYFHKGYVARFVGAGDNNKEKELFESARDTLGHGTHTVSTAAGRRVDNASLLGYAQGTSSGIAPKARIAIYKTCWSDGCMESDILAAMDYAVKDGVDVISLSLGAGPLPYDADVIAIASYVAVKKGIVVTAAAGNKVPPAETVTNVAPWITTVGAGTLDRKFPADLTLEDGRVITGSSLYRGDPLPEKTYYPLIYAGDASVVGSEASAAYCMPRTLDKELVHGKIVVCDVGQISSVGKGVVVKESGGIGVITAYVDPYGEGLLADAYLMPGMSITVSERSTVLDYITSSKDPRATIRFRGTQLGVKPAPTVAFFSSRGPNTISRYVLKPDVIAPGVNILAAWPDHVPPSMISADSRQTKFNILSGTSMSCPHVSGIAALLKGVHPDWSPAMIKSAIMTTAYTRDRNGKALLDETHRTVATVWDMGAGHVDPEKAVDPGLVYDLSEDDYIDFLCATNYSRKGIKVITGKEVMCSGETRKNKPWELNYPAISVSLGVSKGTNSKMEIAVPRTVTYVCDGASTFTAKTTNPKDAKVSVEPEKMVFTKKGEKGSYLVKILVDEGRSKSGTESGTVTWSDGKHEVTSVIVVN